MRRSVTDAVGRFLEAEKAHCDEHGVVIQISPTKPLLHGVPCSGFFIDRPVPTLAAIETDLGIFVHESCHKDQWIEQAPVWMVRICEYYDPNDIIDMWLGRAVELTPLRLTEAMDAVMMLEADCERRSVDKIIRYDLPIDIPRYIQEANAYILFHQFMKESRRFSYPVPAAGVPEIWMAMPDHFMDDADYRNPPPELMDLYRRHMAQD